MLLNSHISAYARCLAGKVCGLVRSTWGTSRRANIPPLSERCSAGGIWLGTISVGMRQPTPDFRAGPSDAGNFNTPPTVKKCGLLRTRTKLTDIPDGDQLRTPQRARGTDGPNRWTAGNSATIPGHRRQRGCTRGKKCPGLRDKISWGTFPHQKLKHKIIPTKPPPPLTKCTCPP